MHIITEPLLEEGLRILQTVGEVKVLEHPSQEVLVKEIVDADAIVVKFAKVTRECIEASKRLKIIAKHGVGVDNIDVETATQRGIWVTNVPSVNADSVAEFTVGLILAVARKIPEGVEQIKAGEWRRESLLGMELKGKCLGIVGFGNIGQRVARKISGFEMRVIAYDPYVSEEKFLQYGVELVDLNTLLKEADIITLHLPLNRETRGLIGEKELRIVKSSAFLINAARSEIVEKYALLSALKEKRLAGAAIDVFDNEPPSPDDPLLKLPNVIGTPHIAAMTREVQEKIVKTVCDDVVRVLNGQVPLNPVNWVET
ncbi:D-3-phosphoglycerate dehydrogenase [Thermanaeromonas toyohensis ToBE]|uniref:2-oxoglutarate reductase n=1 Tax=Thermanaeromonas toyohensis ToBE TaxID=698762 RepID=A0A1W1W1U1_9FIRM|nr:hydroxyacid dehydrogenase [Thermanaeromonas toyohensis]SMB99568.1 D-3-phosphoglycerate dehydrogenase [Thermanaeromonas toyohensis ToBE]